jgi:hypothetical protein
MNKSLDNKYFIILNKDEINFSCLNYENKISFTIKYTLKKELNDLFEELENFFADNIIFIEKSLKDFIKKIYIIIDTDKNLSVNLSTKYKIQTKKINQQKINELLSALKYQFTKYSSDQKIIHMTINKLIVDGEEKDFSYVKEACDNLILEVKFQCLKNQTVQIIRKLCSNYQISVEKILLANHMRQHVENHADNIAFVANKFLIGEVKNEVLWITKKPLNLGFFEKFFKFFN